MLVMHRAAIWPSGLNGAQGLHKGPKGEIPPFYAASHCLRRRGIVSAQTWQKEVSMVAPFSKTMIFIAAGTLSSSGLAGSGHSQESAAPDFSGVWARMTFASEPPVSPPGPL